MKLRLTVDDPRRRKIEITPLITQLDPTWLTCMHTTIPENGRLSTWILTRHLFSSSFFLFVIYYSIALHSWRKNLEDRDRRTFLSFGEGEFR